MTEEQKRAIVETGNMMVIDFERISNKIKLSFEELSETARNCVGCLNKFRENFWKLQMKERYTIARRLNRCGSNEKETNVTVFGAYHYRNNCQSVKNGRQVKTKNWKTCAVAVVGTTFSASICVFGVQGSRNKAIGLEEATEASISDIGVQEKRRTDLLPNLVDTTKQYDKHKAETLQTIVDDRGSAGDIESVTTTITVVTEAYPELKSNENYEQLMTELATTENMIAQYCESYNKQVGTYSRYVKGFLARQFLPWTGYEVLDYQRLDHQAPVDAPTNLLGK